MLSPKTLISAMLVIPMACASISRGQSEVDAVPLTQAYKDFRATNHLLYIQNFENRTYAPQLTGRLKDKLQSAFSRSASLTVTADKTKADIVLYGKILLYGEEPGIFDRASAPLTYNLTLVASTRMRVKIADENGEAPEEQLTVRYLTTYYIGEPVFESRFTAEERLLEGIADRIVASTYEVPPK